MSDEETDEAKLELYNENLTPQQNRAVDLMIEGGMTNREISKEIEVNEKTLWDWQNNNTEFIEEVNLRKKQLFKDFYRKMNSMNVQATEIMEFAMDMAMDNYRDEEIVDNCKKIFDMGDKLLKSTGHHGESLKELIEDMRDEGTESMDVDSELEQAFKRMDKDEVDSLVRVLRVCDPEEIERKLIESDG